MSFIPAALPPRALDSDRLLTPLAAATAAVGRLDGISRQIEHPEWLFRNYLRREAVLSSAIEGTHTTVEGLIRYEATAHGDRDAKEVSNYVDALQFGLGVAKERGVTRQLLNEMHQMLMDGTDPAKTTPGRMRNCLVKLGSGKLEKARFVPPPEMFVDELLDDLIRYLDVDGPPELIKIAIAHYQFETIHPYRDGNGRIGRLLFALYLAQKQMLAAPMLYVSAYLEERREEYYDHLLHVSQRGTWEDWIIFMLKGFELQANDTIERTIKLSELREDYRKRVSGPKRAANLLRLIDALFTVPAISAPIAVTLLGVTYPAARSNLDTLVEVGILREPDPEESGVKFWMAQEIIRILEQPAGHS
ncbi:MAG TPA: Fic family protein [Candidatus Tumulicola sp.]